MEKVKLTREQAEVVEKFKVAYDIAHKLAKAIVEGYEVEEVYKVGDWIARLDGTKFIYGETAVQLTEIGEIFLAYGTDVGVNRSKVRQATPEEIKAEQERRVWAKIGREVSSFVGGDIGILMSGLTARNPEMLERLYYKGELKGFYPAESFISFGGADDDQ